MTITATVLVGFRPHTDSARLALASVLVVVVAIATTMAFSALGRAVNSPATAESLSFVAIPLTFISSAYVPTDHMPSWLRAVAVNQPVTTIIDALRGLFHHNLIDLDPVTVLAAYSWCLAIGLTAAAFAYTRDRRAA